SRLRPALRVFTSPDSLTSPNRRSDACGGLRPRAGPRARARRGASATRLVSHRLSHAAEEIKLDKHQRPPPAAWAAWFMLAGVAVAGLAFGTYDVSIIAVSALLLSLSPFFIERLLQIDIPAGFSVAIAAFLVATLV